MLDTRRHSRRRRGQGGWIFKPSKCHIPFILRIVATVFSLQEHVNLAECWSTVLVSQPALLKQVIDLSRTQYRLVKLQRSGSWVSVTVLAVLYNFFVCQTLVWHFASKCQYLPHCNAKSPNVTFCWKSTLKNTYTIKQLMHHWDS